MSTTLGQISSSGLTRLNTFKCQPGLWITKISGVTNPNGATGIAITCSDGKTQKFGTSTGSPFSFDEPVGIYATGGTTPVSYVSSIGPSAQVTFGTPGKNVWANTTCPAGSRLSGMNIYHDDARIKYIQNPSCTKPTVYVAPTPPPPTIQSCAAGQVVSGVTTVKDSAGKVVGVRYRCSDWTYQPFLGKSSVPAGGSYKLETSTGYGDLTPLALGANVVSTAKCPPGQAYNTITTTSDLKITPSKCVITPPAYEPPVTSMAQDFKCAPGNFLSNVFTKNAPTGLGMQFQCDDRSKTGSWFGPKTGIDSVSNFARGFSKVDYTIDPTLGVTSLTILGNTAGSKIGTAKTFKCPDGQIATGVLGKWTPDKTYSLAFSCAAPPYKILDIPIDIEPVPVPADEPSVPPPAAPTDQATAAIPTPPPIQDVEPTLPVPVVPEIPDYSVVVPTIDTTSSMNTYLMIMLFVVVIAAAIFFAMKFRGRPAANPPTKK